MTQQLLNMNRGHPGGNQVRGIGMTESVRSGADIQPSGVPVKSNELLNGTDREMTAQPIVEERSLRGLRKRELIIEGENFPNALLGHLIKRDNPAARPFANCSGKMEIISGLAIVRDQADRETRHLQAAGATASVRPSDRCDTRTR